jgi:hypothetical protein
MVNNSININKMEQSPQLDEPKKKKDHDILRWKSRAWLGTGTQMWRV